MKKVGYRIVIYAYAFDAFVGDMKLYHGVYQSTFLHVIEVSRTRFYKATDGKTLAL